MKQVILTPWKGAKKGRATSGKVQEPRSPTEGLNMAPLEVDDSEPSGFVGLFVVKPQNVITYFQVLGEMQASLETPKIWL